MNKRQMKKLVWLQLAESLMLGNASRERVAQQISNRNYILSPAALRRLQSAISSVQDDIMGKVK